MAVRWVVVTLVIVGLVFAVERSVSSYHRLVADIDASIARIDSRLDCQTGLEPETRRELVRRRADLRASRPDWRRVRVTWLWIAALAYAVSLLPPALVLRSMVAAMRHPLSVRTAVLAQTIGHLGKYVPGKAMVVVIRSGLLNRRGIPIRVGATAVFAETLLMIGVGAAIGGTIVAMLPVDRWIMVAAILGAIAAAVPTLPPIFRRVVARIAGTDNAISDRSFGYAVWIRCVVWSAVSWTWVGLAMTAVMLAVPSSALTVPDFSSGMAMTKSLASVYPVATAAITTAMVFGFVSLLPGGAGVRELVLIAIIGTVTDPTHGLACAIATRMVFLCVELVSAGFCRLLTGRPPITIASPSDPDDASD